MTNNMPEILFKLKDQTFSISTSNVLSIIKISEITVLPNIDKSMRGIIRYRDKLFPLLDLRTIMDMSSRESEIAEFVAMMEARELDHKNWLAELEKSIKMNCAFKLTTDPHKCAFGKWYDKYKSDSILISSLLEQFDSPHKQIHSIAKDIEKYKKENDFESAQSLINKTRNSELSVMISLFSKIKNAVSSQREFAILLNYQSKKCAVTVDKVESIEFVNSVPIEEGDEELLGLLSNSYVKGLGRLKNGDLSIMINGDSLFNISKQKEPVIV